MRNVIRRLMGKPVQLSPKQEEKLARAYARAPGSNRVRYVNGSSSDAAF